MNLLLDTHIFLWSAFDSRRLSERHLDALKSADHEIWVSAISLWEASIKAQLGKLQFQGNLLEAIARQEFRTLAFEPAHALEVAQLPTVHRDPFDRALLVQARACRFRLVSVDVQITRYASFVDLF